MYYGSLQAVDVLHSAVRLSSIGVAISAAEQLSEFRATGFTFKEKLCEGARLILSIILISGCSIGLGWKQLTLAIAVITAATAFRSKLLIGQGGDVQMTMILMGGVALSAVCDTPRVNAACVVFLASQGCVAYFGAGVLKLLSVEWRSGTALPDVFSTRIFGFPILGKSLQAHPFLSQCLCWGVIIWEVTFPIVLFSSPYVGYMYLFCGVGFHVLAAILMGLNKFVWAFLSLYPPLMWVIEQHSVFRVIQLVS